MIPLLLMAEIDKVAVVPRRNLSQDALLLLKVFTE